jgi:hypothetical protein
MYVVVDNESKCRVASDQPVLTGNPRFERGNRGRSFARAYRGVPRTALSLACGAADARGEREREGARGPWSRCEVPAKLFRHATTLAPAKNRKNSTPPSHRKHPITQSPKYPFTTPGSRNKC